MIKRSKFDVEVSYNPNFFTESELRETMRNSISDLSDSKERKFGRKVIAKPGIHNSGASCNITQLAENEVSNSIDLVETLVSLSSCMNSDTEPNVVLPESKMEEFMEEVRTAFCK